MRLPGLWSRRRSWGAHTVVAVDETSPEEDARYRRTLFNTGRRATRCGSRARPIRVRFLIIKSISCVSFTCRIVSTRVSIWCNAYSFLFLLSSFAVVFAVNVKPSEARARAIQNKWSRSVPRLETSPSNDHRSIIRFRFLVFCVFFFSRQIYPYRWPGYHVKFVRVQSEHGSVIAIVVVIVIVVHAFPVAPRCFTLYGILQVLFLFISDGRAVHDHPQATVGRQPQRLGVCEMFVG